jgi:hypothetical protein
VLVAAFVPAGRGRAPAADDLRDTLAGVRVLLGDRLLRAWTISASLSQMGFQTLLIALPVLAFTRYGQNPRVAGLLIGAWGGGALLGSLVALRLAGGLPPLTVGSLAGLGQALPLWLLVLPLPAMAAVAVLGVAGLANGIRVPPLRAVTLLRIPPPLRVQAMTAEATLPTAAGLLALALASPALETLGVTPVLAGVAAVATTAAVTFASVAMRPQGVGPTTGLRPLGPGVATGGRRWLSGYTGARSGRSEASMMLVINLMIFAGIVLVPLGLAFLFIRLGRIFSSR